MHARNSFIDFAIDTLGGGGGGKMPIVFYGQNTTWEFCPMSLGVLTLMFCATHPFLFLMYSQVIQRIRLHLTLKVISQVLGLAVTVCRTKGDLPYSKRRLAPAMGQDAHSNGKIIIELFLPCIASFCGFIGYFIIERYKHCIKRTDIPI